APGVLDQQHYRLFCDLLSRLVEVAVASAPEPVTSASSEPPVPGDRLFPRVHVGGPRRRSMLGHACGRFHRTCCSTNSFELTGAKGAFGPAFWVKDFFGVHLSIVATGYMCIKDKLKSAG